MMASSTFSPVVETPVASDAEVRSSAPTRSIARVTPLVWLGAITALGLALRLIGFRWGVPYHHFHIDEFFVLDMSDAMWSRGPWQASRTIPKFFMYGPLPPYLLIAARWVYETLAGPLDLTRAGNEITYYTLARTISVVLGTATVPLVYAAARKVAGTTAGLIAAVLMACAVLQLRESHFFTVDIGMTTFATLTAVVLLDVAQTGRWRSYLIAGVTLGLAVLCKYTAIFMLAVVAVAHLCAPGPPTRWRDARAWAVWVLKGLTPPAIMLTTFLALYPIVLMEPAKFRQDVFEWVINPLSGTSRPIWTAQFADIRPFSYWFTNILWWGIGPAFEVWAIAGVGWLLWRRDRLAFVAAIFPLAGFFAVSRTVTPFARYGVPLVPGLAIAAGVLSADLLRRRGAVRVIGLAATSVVVGTTALYALAYMRVYVQPDSRLEASAFLQQHVPAGADVLVEPSHNIPPVGHYLTAPSFARDYVLWGPQTVQNNYYRLYALDTYRYLYDARLSPQQKRDYIAARLALVDYIVMDDTFQQFYAHLPADAHGVVKRYYDDLFQGRLGFRMMETFKVYPGLFGFELNDDAAELSFRLFDHPRVYVLQRTTPRGGR